ncbi:hypothetical protein JT06_14060 [Desulfobulbus sp. Tol-SR]|nr:hypothetical protein JT06_14060 [Desulfobulbus sp. Tol-SR]
MWPASSGLSITASNLSSDLEWFDNGVKFGTGGSSGIVPSPGTHSITATVTDSGGLFGNDNITVTATDTTGITLDVRAYKVRSVKYADLTWSGAGSDQVDIKRNNTIFTITNVGAYKDTLTKSTVSATYQVCEKGTAACSNSVTTVGW